MDVAKEKKALDVLAGVVAADGGVALAFGGGKDSVALLHMARRASGGSVRVPVLTLDPPKEYVELYFFIEKLRALWGLAPVFRWMGGPGPDAAGPYPGIGRVSAAAAGLGYARLLTGLRADEEGAAGVSAENACGGATLVNPLFEFTEEEVFGYIERHGLPICSLYRARKKLWCITGGVRVASQPPPMKDEEDEKVRARLKGLGYL